MTNRRWNVFEISLVKRKVDWKENSRGLITLNVIIA